MYDKLENMCPVCSSANMMCVTPFQRSCITHLNPGKTGTAKYLYVKVPHPRCVWEDGDGVEEGVGEGGSKSKICGDCFQHKTCPQCYIGYSQQKSLLE